MNGDANLAAIASLIADRNRAQVLLALLGGEPQTGFGLAEAAGISRSLASAHLKKLVAGGLVKSEARGRLRLYSIASQPVADAIEGLILLSPPSEVRSLRGATRSTQLRLARLCYDHLAGVLGVAVTDALVSRRMLRRSDGGFEISHRGRTAFDDFGIDIPALERRRRPLLRPCMDWSEGREHLAGSLGAALGSELLRRDWIRGREASRIVRLTPAGETGLADWLGVDIGEGGR